MSQDGPTPDEGFIFYEEATEIDPEDVERMIDAMRLAPRPKVIDTWTGGRGDIVTLLEWRGIRMLSTNWPEGEDNR